MHIQSSSSCQESYCTQVLVRGVQVCTCRDFLCLYQFNNCPFLLGHVIELFIFFFKEVHLFSNMVKITNDLIQIGKESVYFDFQLYFLSVCMCAPECMCVHYAHRRCSQRPEEVGQSRDLELKVVVSYPVWMMGTEPESSAKAAE